MTQMPSNSTTKQYIVVVLVGALFLDQIDLFTNDLYLLGLCAKKHSPKKKNYTKVNMNIQWIHLPNFLNNEC